MRDLDRILYELDADTYIFMYEAEMKRIEQRFTAIYMSDRVNRLFDNIQIRFDDAKDVFVVTDESPYTGIKYKMIYSHNCGIPGELISVVSNVGTSFEREVYNI